MRAVRYHPEARAEFLREVEYYADISTRLAELYDKAVHTAEMQAAATPEAYTERKGVLIILLAGGDKSSQQRDIETALTLARGLLE